MEKSHGSSPHSYQLPHYHISFLSPLLLQFQQPSLAPHMYFSSVLLLAISKLLFLLVQGALPGLQAQSSTWLHY